MILRYTAQDDCFDITLKVFMTPKNTKEHTFLRVVVDNSHRVKVVEAPQDQPPFPIQAEAVEEDTALVLSADSSIIYDTDEHPISLMTALYEEPTRIPGSVVIQGSKPYLFSAIVHDFNQHLSFREEWVWSALNEILLQCEKKKITALKLSPIGTRHGTLAFSDFLQHLNSILARHEARSLKQIWLATS